MEPPDNMSFFCMQTTLLVLMSTVLYWWGCCNRSIKQIKNSQVRSLEETKTATVQADSGTKTVQVTAGDDGQSMLLSKSKSVPHSMSEKVIERTQSETMKLVHQSLLKSKSLNSKKLNQTEPDNSHVKRNEEQDSFARHIPKKLVARRSIEIKSKPPVCCDRDDYKTIPTYMLPSSNDDL